MTFDQEQLLQLADVFTLTLQSFTHISLDSSVYLNFQIKTITNGGRVIIFFTARKQLLQNR
jgi:hypothetical protein